MKLASILLLVASGDALRMPSAPVNRRAALGKAAQVRLPARSSCLLAQSTQETACACCLGQVLLPLAALPSVASAACAPNCGAEPFAIAPNTARDAPAANSAFGRAATPSVSGNYEDPMHPGMKRKVSKSGKFVFVNGADEDGKKFKLDGSVEQHRQTPL